MNTNMPNLEGILKANNYLKEAIQHLNMAAYATARRVNRKRFKKGIQHEQRIYTGLIDRLYVIGNPKYTLQDIQRGYTEEQRMAAGNLACLGIERKPVEAPTNPYWIGRYVAKGNRLLECSERNGDVATALEALRIFRWLGQDQRLSVRNRVNRVYNLARAISEKYDVPITDSTDRKYAVLPSAVYGELTQYLKHTLA